VADRREWITLVVGVRHYAKPIGKEPGPHLADLREFVAACEGLPDDLQVKIDVGSYGDRTVTIEVREETRRSVGE
jgi:hypothetical protein